MHVISNIITDHHYPVCVSATGLICVYICVYTCRCDQKCLFASYQPYTIAKAYCLLLIVYCLLYVAKYAVDT